MRAIRKVAATGRAVICTIHQPSTYLFEMFDSLLLLKKGGQVVFFGPLGENSGNLITYFQVKADHVREGLAGGGAVLDSKGKLSLILAPLAAASLLSPGCCGFLPA